MQKSCHNLHEHSNLNCTIPELGVWQALHCIFCHFPWRCCMKNMWGSKKNVQNLRFALRSAPCDFAKRVSCKMWSFYNIIVDCSNRSHGRHGRCSLAWSTGIQNIRKTVGCLVDEFFFSLLQFASHLDNSLGCNSKQHSDNTGQSYKYIKICVCICKHTHTKNQCFFRHFSFNQNHEFI